VPGILTRSVVLQAAAIAVMLSLSRAIGRRLFSSAEAASTAAVRTAQNPLEEFFEVERSTEEGKPPPHYGMHPPPFSLARRIGSWCSLTSSVGVTSADGRRSQPIEAMFGQFLIRGDWKGSKEVEGDFYLYDVDLSALLPPDV
jgi:hypothetical protein